MFFGKWMGIAALALLSSWSVTISAHEGKTDASGCHGRELTGIDHCHVEAVSLETAKPSTVNLADARRGARELELPGCLTCEDVAKVQQKLAQLGHPPGPIDGIIGPLTRAAIESYQRAHGLTVDGRTSAELMTRLGLSY